jgi:hypothetical protein
MPLTPDRPASVRRSPESIAAARHGGIVATWLRGSSTARTRIRDAGASLATSDWSGLLPHSSDRQRVHADGEVTAARIGANRVVGVIRHGVSPLGPSTG